MVNGYLISIKDTQMIPSQNWVDSEQMISCSESPDPHSEECRDYWFRFTQRLIIGLYETPPQRFHGWGRCHRTILIPTHGNMFVKRPENDHLTILGETILMTQLTVVVANKRESLAYGIRTHKSSRKWDGCSKHTNRGCLLFSAPRRVATTGTDMLLVSQTRLDACLGSTPFGIKLINFDRHTTSYMLGV